MKTICLIRVRESERETWVDYFQVDDECINPEGKIRSIVRAYLETEDGQKSVEQTNNDFNWGDVLMYVPKDFWEIHGVRPLSHGNTAIIVDQDEVLC